LLKEFTTLVDCLINDRISTTSGIEWWLYTYMPRLQTKMKKLRLTSYTTAKHCYLLVNL